MFRLCLFVWMGFVTLWFFNIPVAAAALFEKINATQTMKDCLNNRLCSATQCKENEMSETPSRHHCTSVLSALSTSQDFGMHLWDYFSGSILNKIRVSLSTCGLCSVICLAERPNLLLSKSTEFLLPKGWSNKMTFAVSRYHVEGPTSDYAIRGEIERKL